MFGGCLTVFAEDAIVIEKGSDHVKITTLLAIGRIANMPTTVLAYAEGGCSNSAVER
jgi:hypothetical protein